MFASLKQGLQKTRNFLVNKLDHLFHKNFSSNNLAELEALLLQADLGIDPCNKIINKLKQVLPFNELTDAPKLYLQLEQILLEILTPYAKPISCEQVNYTKPVVMLFVGINGAGKTTTIGKLAYKYKNAGKTVSLAAGDTFRAAAIEQLTAWGTKLALPVYAKTIGADSASVIFDAYKNAQQNEYKILLADTAGRLHTKKNLMDELAKISKVLNKLDPLAPQATILVLDASLGQNSLQQAKTFHAALGITNIIVTKLDGTAKAGIIFAIADQLKIPISYIGIGEQLDDLTPFNAQQFVRSLLEK